LKQLWLVMLRTLLSRGSFSILLSLGVTLGCAVTSGSARPGPLGLSGQQSSWAIRMFGRPPELVTVFRPYPGMNAKELEIQLAENSVLGFATLHCRQGDTYVYGDVDRYLTKNNDDFEDGVVVLHGVPPWLDPLRPPKGEVDVVFDGQAGSGVRAYSERKPTKYRARLFVLPSSTWVISHGAVGDRLARELASDSAEPPPLAAAPGSFIEERRRVDPAIRRDLANLGWTPELKDLNRLEAGGQVVYPMTRGQPLVIGLELVFSDETAARDAADEAMRDPRLHNKDFVGVDRFGTAIVIKSLASQ
jgi:hypothetical protein